MGMNLAQWGVERSSPLGRVRSLDFAGPAAIVSVAHLRECLTLIEDEKIDASIQSGTLRLKAANADIAVYTVRSSTPWQKVHVPGEVTESLTADAMNKVSMGKAPLSASPVLKNGSLFLPYHGGVVRREGMPVLRRVLSPSEALLRALSNVKAETLEITSNSYWRLTTQGTEMVFTGYRGSDVIADVYSQPDREIAQFPATQFLYAVRAATRLAAEGSRSTFNWNAGLVSAMDQFGNTSSFKLDPANIPSFQLLDRTVALAAHTLEQGVGDVVSLHLSPSGNHRLVRGEWSVGFKGFSV